MWDAAAKACLQEYYPLRSVKNPAPDEIQKRVVPHLKRALVAGCDDPFLQYLSLRFVATDPPRDAKSFAEEFARLVPRMQETGYSDYLKFCVTLRGSQAIKAAQNNTPPLVHQYRHDSVKYLAQCLADTKMPALQVDEALQLLYDALKLNSSSLRSALTGLEDSLTKNWSKLAAHHLFKGRVYIKLAWEARGSRYADKVTELGWKGFEENVTLAEKALSEAWTLDPKDSRIPVEMITVELAQGKGRQRMELWFQRAMALDSANLSACNAKRNYLEPKWYGSASEMLAFGRECVASKVWKGRVPLILLDAHEGLAAYIKDPDERKAYWKQAEVWKDVKHAFERFFELNPEQIGWRHNYAKYAYLCEQWDDLNRQLKLLGEVNYDFFGGKPAYDKMVRLAKEHATP